MKSPEANGSTATAAGTPKVSIVIPAWNCAAFIGETLASVAAQKLPDWEVVLVNDGSTDGTLDTARAIAQQMPPLKVVSQPNRGPAVARNTGFKAASSDSGYILFLDADDLLEPHALGEACAYLDAHPEVGLVHFDAKCIDAQGRDLPPGGTRYSPSEARRLVPRLLWARPLRDDEVETPFVSIYTLAGILPSFAVLRRSVFEKVGGWDENLRQMYEDTDLWLRVALNSRVHYLPRQLGRYRRHAGQSTSAARSHEFRDRHARLLQKWSRPAGMTAEQWGVVRDAEHFRAHGLALYNNLRLIGKYVSCGDLHNALRFAYGAARVLLGLTSKSPPA